MLELLFKHDGVSGLMNKQSQSGSTPIHCAISRGHLDAAKFLLDKGADLSLTDEDGKTPGALAKEAGKPFEKLFKGKK